MPAPLSGPPPEGTEQVSRYRSIFILKRCGWIAEEVLYGLWRANTQTFQGAADLVVHVIGHQGMRLDRR